MGLKKRPKPSEKKDKRFKYTRSEILSWENEFYEACRTGMSLRAFLGSKGVGRDYFDERANNDCPELYSIMEKGRAIQEEHYRKLLTAISVGKMEKGANCTGIIWITKALCGWKDPHFNNQEVEVESQESGKIVFKARFGNGSSDQ